MSQAGQSPEESLAAFRRGVEFMQAGRNEDAVPEFLRAISLRPAFPEAFANLGIAMHLAGQTDRAIIYIKEAVRLTPGFANARANLASLLAGAGRLDEAAECYVALLAIRPDDPGPIYSLATIAYRQGRLDDAAGHYRRFLAARPDHADAHCSLGLVLAEQGDCERAVESFASALAINPGHSPSLDNIAKALVKLGKTPQALEYQQKYVSIQPTDAAGWSNLGDLHRTLNQLPQAGECYERALAIKPDFAECWCNLGYVHAVAGRDRQAGECVERALAINPNCPEAYYNLGVMQADRRQARQAYEKAISIKSDYHQAKWNLALLDLLEGDFQAGWRNYESRLYLSGHEAMLRFNPRWTAQDISGKTLLVMHEQGFGDTIQFLRFLAPARRRCAKLVFCCQPQMLPLLKDLSGPDWIATDPAETKWDVAVWLLSLPGIFRTSLDAIPPAEPFLKAPADKVELWKPKMRPGDINIGLAWSGNPDNPLNRGKRISLDELKLIWKTPRVRFHSLQLGVPAGEILQHPDLQIEDHSGRIADFADTAGLIANLDLVITIDTAVAHLAGAMGRPVWLLLQYQADWRWLLDCDDCPWYPTARLFRQPRRGDWNAAVANVKKELESFIAGGKSG
ncbi:MAG: tetratricopeptide repeat protein [Planctomycetes bacterium]|nr:tetratricopeptide repeat protein [Planctomycetota bacterium]